jgi:hypothetical protein
MRFTFCPLCTAGPGTRAGAGSGAGAGFVTKAFNLLTSAGLNSHEIDRSSKCARLAIARGYIVFDGTAAEMDGPVLVNRKINSASTSTANASSSAHAPVTSSAVGPTVLEIPCLCCRTILKPTLRQLLRQSDCPGLDYEDGRHYGGAKHTFTSVTIPTESLDAAALALAIAALEEEMRLREKYEECGGTYVTRMCEGIFEAGTFALYLCVFVRK